MGGPARRFAGFAIAIAFVVAIAPASAATLALAPGQPFDRAAADTLLGPPLAERSGVEKVRVHVEDPALPLGNPYPAVAELAVADARLTTDDGFVAVVTITVGERAPLRLVLRGRVSTLVGLPVPAAPIAAGTRLADAAFETLWLTAPRVRGQWIKHPEEFAGKVAHRPLIAGKPIARDAVGARRLVRRGERVTIVFAAAGLRLEATGNARADAGLGETVEVENDRSGTIVSGRVSAAGRVHVEKR